MISASCRSESVRLRPEFEGFGDAALHADGPPAPMSGSDLRRGRRMNASTFSGMVDLSGVLPPPPAPTPLCADLDEHVLVVDRMSCEGRDLGRGGLMSVALMSHPACTPFTCTVSSSSYVQDLPFTRDTNGLPQPRQLELFLVEDEGEADSAVGLLKVFELDTSSCNAVPSEDTTDDVLLSLNSVAFHLAAH